MDVDAKVADVKTLLSMKAEREQLENIDSNIGVVKKDLKDIRNALPASKELMDNMHRMRNTLDTKADKNIMDKLAKTVRNGMKEETDPAFIKRCLSCDKPLGNKDEAEEMAQTAFYQQYVTTLAQMKSPQQKHVEKYEHYEREKYGDRGGYQGYTKPKSPYSKLTSSSRPKSAHAKIHTASDERKQRQDSIKYGSSQPLHVTLFANDSPKVIRSRPGPEVGGRSSPSPQTPPPAKIERVAPFSDVRRGDISPWGAKEGNVPTLIVERHGVPLPIPKR
jgi:hypothetical protein